MKTRKQLKSVSPYSVPEYSRLNKIRLDLNENLFGCSQKVINALKNAKGNYISAYPENFLLINKLAKTYNVKKENFLLTNGADDAIRCVLDTFLDRDDEIIIPTPNYSMFELYAKLSGARIKNIKYENDFSFPTEKVIKSISAKTKIIVIVNPANPLGTMIDKSDLIKILEKAKDKIVLLDETYYHFIGTSYIELIKKYKNLIIVQTFSKIYGLAAMRVGFVAAAENYLEEMNKIAFPYPVTYHSILAAAVAIDDEKHCNDILNKVKTEKEYLIKEFNNLGIEVKNTLTNFILVKIGNNCNKIHKLLFEKNILVKSLDHAPLLKGYLRITIGSRRENKILISTIKEILNKL